MQYETASAEAGSSASSGLENVQSYEKDFPSFLPIGTPVSAKYRGAFCEAKISKIDRNFRLRVQVENPKIIVNVEKEGFIFGVLEPNMQITIKWPLNSKGLPTSDSSEKKTVTVLKVIDLSRYTVVFDDGDTRILKRTQLVLKGARHFKESESLDKLPLTNPEQFKQPVIDKKRTQPSRSCSSDEEDLDITKMAVYVNKSEIKSSKKIQSSCSLIPKDQFELIKSEFFTNPSLKSYLGRIVMVDTPSSVKDSILSSDTSVSTSIMDSSSASCTSQKYRRGPGIVCLSSACPSLDLKAAAALDTNTSNQVAFVVKMFRDNKFHAVPICHLKRLDRSKVVKLAHKNQNLINAFDRAVLWLDRKELPSQWGSDAVEVLFGSPNWRFAVKTKNPDLGMSHLTKSKSGSNDTKKPTFDNQSTSFDKKKGPKTKEHSPTKSIPEIRRKSPRSVAKVSNVDESFVNRQLDVPAASTPIKGRSIRTKINPNKTADGTTDENTMALTHESADSSSDESSDDSKSQDESSSTNTLFGTSSEDELASSSSNSDSEDRGRTFEEKDRWIAYLYRFMDERSTPINKAPAVGNKDLDLYKLHKLVNKVGGFHRATYQLKWPAIYSKLGLPSNFAAGSKNLQTAYKKYIYPLDDLSKKLGATNLNDNIVLVTSRSRSSSTVSTPVKKSKQQNMDKNPCVPTSRGLNQPLTPSPPHLTAEAPSRSPLMSPSTPGSQCKSGHEQFDSLTIAITPKKIGSDHVLSAETSPKRGAAKKDVSSSKLKEEIISCPKSKKRTFKSMTELNKTTSELEDSKCLTSFGAPELSSLSSAGSGLSSSEGEQNSLKESRPLTTKKANLSQLLLDSIHPPGQVIPVNSKVQVRFSHKIYLAKIIRHFWPGEHEPDLSPNIKTNISRTIASLHYKVHYLGWNTRHDEVVSPSRIVSVIDWAPAIDPEPAPSCASTSNLHANSNLQTASSVYSSVKVESPIDDVSIPETETKASPSRVSTRRSGESPNKNVSPAKIITNCIETIGRLDEAHKVDDTASDIVTTAVAPVIRPGRGRPRKQPQGISRNVESSSELVSKKMKIIQRGERRYGRRGKRTLTTRDSPKYECISSENEASETSSRREPPFRARGRGRRVSRVSARPARQLSGGIPDLPSSVSENEKPEESADEENLGDMYAFPRLTRRQHKQLMGADSPHGSSGQNISNEVKISPIRFTSEDRQSKSGSPAKSIRSNLSVKKEDEDDIKFDEMVQSPFALGGSPGKRSRSSKLPVTSPISSVSSHGGLGTASADDHHSQDSESIASTIGMHWESPVASQKLLMNPDEIRIERNKIAFIVQRMKKVHESSSSNESSDGSSSRVNSKDRSRRKSEEIRTEFSAADDEKEESRSHSCASRQDDSSSSEETHRPRVPGRGGPRQRRFQRRSIKSNLDAPDDSSVHSVEVTKFEGDSDRLLDQLMANSSTSIPSKRRFGGPFLPMNGLNLLPSQAKCLMLERTMQNILIAWRSAKKSIKDLDPRSSRAKRIRVVQRLPTAVSSSVQPTMAMTPTSITNS